MRRRTPLELKSEESCRRRQGREGAGEKKALCMTVSRNLVNYKKFSWYKKDARNGKSVMKFVRRSILRPLAFM